MSNRRLEYTVYWYIENYSYCWHKNGKFLISPVFTTDELEGTAWKLRLYPKGCREIDEGYISLCLQRCFENDGPKNISIEFELSILALNTPLIGLGKCELEQNDFCGFFQFLRLEEIRLRRKEDFLPNDTLTVRCKIRKGEGSVCKFPPFVVRTGITIENISFFHLVDKFSALPRNKKKTFKTHYHSNNKWILSSDLYCSKGKIVFEIKPSNSNYILCKRNVFLLDESGNLNECGKNDIRLDDERKDIKKLTFSISKQDILDNKDKYLPDDRLTLLCQCAFSTGYCFEKIERNQFETPTIAVDKAVFGCLSKNFTHTTKNRFQISFPKVVEDVKNLYVNQCITDVELKTKTRSFKSHKLLLCLRSPVFYTILTSDMKEKCNNCIQVADLEDEIVEQLLLFLYSDKIENLNWSNATQLYYAADKYQIGGLKELCSSFLVENLNTSNVAELLILSETHNDTDLKKLVEVFILQHEEQVFGSKEWDTFVETYPMLALKIMHLKYKRKRSKLSADT